MDRSLRFDRYHGLNEINEVVLGISEAEHLNILIEDAKKKHRHVDAFPLMVAVLADIGEFFEFQLLVLGDRLGRVFGVLALFDLLLVLLGGGDLFLLDNNLLV